MCGSLNRISTVYNAALQITCGAFLLNPFVHFQYQTQPAGCSQQSSRWPSEALVKGIQAASAGSTIERRWPSGAIPMGLST